ncbi:MAG: hypothetical protein ACTSU2_01775 [Promethearchaeota archaeon]
MSLILMTLKRKGRYYTKKLSKDIKKNVSSMIILLFVFQILIISANTFSYINTGQNSLISKGSGDGSGLNMQNFVPYSPGGNNNDNDNKQSNNEDSLIKYYEETYKPYVRTRIPHPAYREEYGIWKKGDPTVHTKDGDFELWGSNEKTVDELAQDAINHGLDFIGITNLDKVKIYIPETPYTPPPISGEHDLYADLSATWNAVSNARYKYEGQLAIFMGVEKTVGEITYFGAGKRIQCLLPYNPNYEWNYIQNLMNVDNLDDILSVMASSYGEHYEYGTTIFSVNDGYLDFWSVLDFQKLAQAPTTGGVMSVKADTVHPFIEYSNNPDGQKWDYYLAQKEDIFGAAGSDYYTKGSGGPGHVAKTYVKVWNTGYYGIMEGFSLGRVFSVQNDIITGLQMELRDNYDNIAYMGDTMESYGVQTLKIDLTNQVAIQSVKVITNYGGQNQIYKTFTSADYDTSEPGHIKMECNFEHSDAPYFIRLEGIDGNGNRFFSAPIFYEKSNMIFPEIHITNPPVDDFYINNASLNANGKFDLEWTQSEDLGGATVDVWYNTYREPESYESGDGDFTIIDGGKTGTAQIVLEEGWNTIMVKAFLIGDPNGLSARDITHIYYNKSAPIVNIININNGTYISNNSITIKWEAFASGAGNYIDNFSVWRDNNLDRSDGLSNTTSEKTFSSLTEGNHSFYVQAFQAGSNKYSVTTHIEVQIDRTPPAIVIQNPVNNSVYNENNSDSINLTINVNEPSLKILKCYIEVYRGASLIKNQSITEIQAYIPYNYSLPTQDGKYTIKVTCIDYAHNIGTTYFGYSVDRYMPFLGIPYQFYFNNTDPIISWSAGDSATYIDKVWINFNNSTTFLPNTTMQYQFHLPGEGIYNFSLGVNDSQGHSRIINSKIIVDNSSPIIYSIWVDDKFYGEYSQYFKIGITTKDGLSGIKLVTLYYNIYNDPTDNLSGSMVKQTAGESKIVFEIPRSTIASKMDDYECNVSFSFVVTDNVNLKASTKTYEHHIELQIPPKQNNFDPAKLLAVAITAGVVLAVGSIVWLRWKKQRDRDLVSRYL